MRELTIDPEFAALLPPLSAAELDRLREGLESDRVCHAAIVEWANHGILIDGHNRYPICRELKIPYEIVSLPFADRLEVKQWIIRTQAGRRNISPDQLALLLGEEYEREKSAVPNPQGRNQHSEVSGHSDHQPKAAERVAERNGVSEATVRRAARTLKAARTVAENTSSTPAEVVAKVGRAAVEEIAHLPEKAQVQAVEIYELNAAESGATQPDIRPQKPSSRSKKPSRIKHEDREFDRLLQMRPDAFWGCIMARLDDAKELLLCSVDPRYPEPMNPDQLRTLNAAMRSLLLDDLASIEATAAAIVDLTAKAAEAIRNQLSESATEGAYE